MSRAARISTIECSCNFCGKLGECRPSESGPKGWLCFIEKGSRVQDHGCELACSRECLLKHWKPTGKLS